MLSREEYITKLEEEREQRNREYSKPKYICPKCGGGMRKNLRYGEVLTTYPPIYKDFYKCDTCGFEETICHWWNHGFKER